MAACTPKVIMVVLQTHHFVLKKKKGKDNCSDRSVSSFSYSWECQILLFQNNQGTVFHPLTEPYWRFKTWKKLSGRISWALVKSLIKETYPIHCPDLWYLKFCAFQDRHCRRGALSQKQKWHSENIGCSVFLSVILGILNSRFPNPKAMGFPISHISLEWKAESYYQLRWLHIYGQLNFFHDLPQLKCWAFFFPHKMNLEKSYFLFFPKRYKMKLYIQDRDHMLVPIPISFFFFFCFSDKHIISFYASTALLLLFSLAGVPLSSLGPVEISLLLQSPR